mgnify:CR=1 FL=1
MPHVSQLYADLSGWTEGWRWSKPPEWFKQIFYWPTAHEKILFGSDVHADEVPPGLSTKHNWKTSIGKVAGRAIDEAPTLREPVTAYQLELCSSKIITRFSSNGGGLNGSTQHPSWKER